MTDQAGTTGQGSGREVARRSRRQLLAGGTGAVAAVLAAEALARPTPPPPTATRCARLQGGSRWPAGSG